MTHRREVGQCPHQRLVETTTMSDEHEVFMCLGCGEQMTLRSDGGPPAPYPRRPTPELLLAEGTACLQHIQRITLDGLGVVDDSARRTS